MQITVHYMDYFAPVDELDMLVVSVQVYNLILRSTCCENRNPDIHWAWGWLTSPQSPSASWVEDMKTMTMAVASNISEAGNDTVNDQLPGHDPDIQAFVATTFDDLLVSDEVLVVFAPSIGQCTGLLGATLECITLDSTGNSDQHTECDEQGAAVVVVVEETLWGDAWMTTTGSTWPQGSIWTAGPGSWVGEPLMTRPPGIHLSSFVSSSTSLFLNT